MTIRLTIEAYARAIRKVYKDTLRSVMKTRATLRNSRNPLSRVRMYTLMHLESVLGEALFNWAVDSKADENEVAFVEAQVLKLIAGRMERQAMRDWEAGN